MTTSESNLQKVDISIVTTLYCSSLYIRDYYARILIEANKISGNFEIIFVNDGSPDDSLAIALEIASKDLRVKVIDFSRNFGHHNAIIAGLDHSSGDLVFLIDVDLEEAPELLSKFYEEFHLGKNDVVYGVQVLRNGGWFRGNFVGLFYSLFNFFSETKIPQNVCTVRLMSKEYVKAFLQIKESSIFLAGTFSWIGFRQKAFPIMKKQRHEPSSYGLIKMLKLLVNAIIGFSSYPLVLAFLMGLVISSVSALAGFVIAVRKLFFGEGMLLGWSSIMATIWFLGGLTIFFVGLVGLYLSKTYLETKKRPIYIIRKVYEGGRND